MSMLVETGDDHLLPNSQASVAVNVLTRQTRCCAPYGLLRPHRSARRIFNGSNYSRTLTYFFSDATLGSSRPPVSIIRKVTFLDILKTTILDCKSQVVGLRVRLRSKRPCCEMTLSIPCTWSRPRRTFSFELKNFSKDYHAKYARGAPSCSRHLLSFPRLFLTSFDHHYAPKDLVQQPPLSRILSR
ncbi:hypothetical protein IQ07DRAFT_419816 [Pyrenochaeta sp. DS3sAY3a]|nr:hypothetical protein IQ07DRAFT_419816 [Pyrenochaeta sp. DS3sAY3a]